MKRMSIIAAVLPAMLAGGCNQPTMTESKQEAYKEWANSRVKIYYSLACDQYKSGQLAKARKKAIEALAIDDTNTPLRLLLGRVYLEEGMYAAAAAELEIVIEQTPESSEGFYLLGVAYEKNAQPEEAISNYNRAFELDRTNIAPVEAAAEVLVSLDEVPQAQAYLEKHMNHKDAKAGTYELAGRFAMILKQYDKAANYFQQACDADTKNRRYPEMRATAQFRAKDFRAAAGTIEKFLASATKLKKVKKMGEKDYKPRAWVYIMLGDCYISLHDNKLAEKAYKRACKLRADQPGTWVKLAKAALLQSKTTSAIHAAHQARRLDEGHLEATMILAYAMIREGNISPAITVLKRARTIHFDDPMLVCLLGKAYAAKGEKTRARELFASAMRTGPRNNFARELFLRSTDARPGRSTSFSGNRSGLP